MAHTKRFDSDDDFRSSAEQVDLWFLGSLINGFKSPNFSSPHFRRSASLHNRITMDDTNFDERFQANMLVAYQLSEFFPLKWLLEITSSLRRFNSSKLSFVNNDDRFCCFLGYIELYLAFRGLTLLDSTLSEINNSKSLNLTKDQVRTWKLKLLRITPELRDHWTKVRAQTHQTALLSTVIQIMNRDLDLKDFSKKEIFLTKQACLTIAREFVHTKKALHIKKPEVWARAICLKAVQETLPYNSHFPFPFLPPESQKVIQHKKWKLDRALKTHL
ncbi:MAG: hypothetical protein ACXADY_17785 [Candidatus Hodarchaeales archaeon]|jgi:hypothetical protein